MRCQEIITNWIARDVPFPTAIVVSRMKRKRLSPVPTVRFALIRRVKFFACIAKVDLRTQLTRVSVLQHNI